MAAPRPSRVKLSEIKTKLLRPALTSHYICDFQPPASADGFLLARVLNTPTKRADRLSLACSERLFQDLLYRLTILLMILPELLKNTHIAACMTTEQILVFM